MSQVCANTSRDVYVPSEYSFIGTLFDKVAGKPIKGIRSAGNSGRASLSILIEVNASKPPIIKRPWMLCFCNCFATPCKSTLGKTRFTPSSDPPDDAHESTRSHVALNTRSLSNPTKPLLIRRGV